MIGLEFIIRNSNLNFRKVAKILGISPTTLADWVKVRRNIPIARRKQLADYFGLKEDYFQKKLSRVEELEILKQNVSRHMIANAEVIERTIVDELGDKNLIEDTYYEPELQEKMRLFSKEQERARIHEVIDKMVQADDGEVHYLDFFKDLIRVVKDERTRRLIFLFLGAVIPGIGTVSYVGVQDEQEAEFTRGLEEQLKKLGFKGRSNYRYPEHSS